MPYLHVAGFMSDNPAISAHIGLLAQSQGDGALAGTADAASEHGRNKINNFNNDTYSFMCWATKMWSM